MSYREKNSVFFYSQSANRSTRLSIIIMSEEKKIRMDLWSNQSKEMLLHNYSLRYIISTLTFVSFFENFLFNRIQSIYLVIIETSTLNKLRDIEHNQYTKKKISVEKHSEMIRFYLDCVKINKCKIHSFTEIPHFLNCQCSKLLFLFLYKSHKPKV